MEANTANETHCPGSEGRKITQVRKRNYAPGWRSNIRHLKAGDIISASPYESRTEAEQTELKQRRREKPESKNFAWEFFVSGLPAGVEYPCAKQAQKHSLSYFAKSATWSLLLRVLLPHRWRVIGRVGQDVIGCAFTRHCGRTKVPSTATWRTIFWHKFMYRPQQALDPQEQGPLPPSKRQRLYGPTSPGTSPGLVVPASAPGRYISKREKRQAVVSTNVPCTRHSYILAISSNCHSHNHTNWFITNRNGDRNRNKDKDRRGALTTRDRRNRMSVGSR